MTQEENSDMKKAVYTITIFAAMFVAAMTATSCSTSNSEQQQLKYGLADTAYYIGDIKLPHKAGYTDTYDAVILEINGHEYLVLQSVSQLGICHYESCKYCTN